MFLVSFATNIYFYIENQELLHNLAYKEIHETLKIEECKKLLALQDKKFHEQINDNLMKHRSEGLYSNLKLSDSVGFNPAHDQPPAMVKGMPPVNHKYVPNPQINAAPIMVGNQEELNNHLEEPEEDFQNDFNYDDKGDQYYDGGNNFRANGFNNRIQLNEPEVVPEVPAAPVVNAVPNAALEHIEQQEQIFEKNLQQQHLIAEEQKQLTDSLRDVLELINSRGADKFAEELMAKGASDIAQTVEEFSQAEADPGQEFEGDLDVAEIEDIKSEVDDFIAENPQYEAEPAAEQDDFGFGNREEPAEDGFGNDPLPESDPFGAPVENNEEPNFGFEPDNGDVDSDSDNFDQEPAGFEAEPAGFGGEPGGFDQEPAFGEEQAPVEPDMNYADQEPNGQEGQEDPLGNEFPEIEPESDAFNANEDEQGFDLNADQVADSEINVEGESLNLERPIGDQELQSQRAESLQTGEAILNQNLDNFLPQVNIFYLNLKSIYYSRCPVVLVVQNHNSHKHKIKQFKHQISAM